MATVFENANFDVSVLLRAIFLRNEFWSPTAKWALVRSPTEYIVAALRGTGMTAAQVHPEWFSSRMGQALFYPPNVAGWKNNKAWLGTSAVAARADFADTLNYRLDQLDLHPLLAPILPDSSIKTPDQLVDIVLTLLDVSVSTGTRTALRDWVVRRGRSEPLDDLSHGDPGVPRARIPRGVTEAPTMLSNDIESNDTLRHLQRIDTSPSGLSRRRFLQAIAAGIGVGAAASLLPTGVADALTAIGAHDGVLLLVNLAGGLDGLNTVVPFGQSEYYDLRPSVNIAEAEVLPLASGIGLHPSLPFFKSQFDAGSLAIVQGVGAIDPDYSHFSMGARWMSGWAGTPANPTSGWVGRWLDGLATPDLLQAVEIGWGGVGLHMIGDNRAAVSVNPSDAGYGSDTNNWIQDSYRAVREMSAATIPGTWSKAFADTLRDQLTVAAAAAPAYVGVPNTSLGKFAIAAGLINANVGLRVVSVTIGGFDNHSSQPADLAALLTQLNDGLQLFWSTLSPLFQTVRRS